MCEVQRLQITVTYASDGACAANLQVLNLGVEVKKKIVVCVISEC